MVLPFMEKKHSDKLETRRIYPEITLYRLGVLSTEEIKKLQNRKVNEVREEGFLCLNSRIVNSSALYEPILPYVRNITLIKQKSGEPKEYSICRMTPVTLRSEDQNLREIIRNRLSERYDLVSVGYYPLSAEDRKALLAAADPESFDGPNPLSIDEAICYHQAEN